MRRFRDGEGGQAILVIAAMMMTLLMFVGLAIDAGQLFVARRTMQEAADAAAYAGAVVLYQHQTQGLPASLADAQSDARLAAATDAALNGFADGVDGADVTISLPPTSGPFAGNGLYIEVVIRADVRTALVPAQSLLTTVGVRGVAGAEPLNNQFAIMALDRGNTPNALNIQPGGVVDLTGGGILVNSTNTAAQAAWNQGSEQIRFTCVAPAVCVTHVAGDVQGDFPALITGAPQEPDPFAGFPKPPIPDCASGGNTSCLFNSRPTGVAEPGVYTVSLRAAGSANLVLKPGIYILKAGMDLGGDSSVTSANGTTNPACLAHCGVFLFNTTMNYPEPGGTCGQLNLFGNATTSLLALSSEIPGVPEDPRNTYLNFLVYQDADCTAEMVIAGSSQFLGSGTLYLPSANFRFAGQNATLTGSQVVANTVDIQEGDIKIVFSADNSAQPVLPRLAE